MTPQGYLLSVLYFKYIIHNYMTNQQIFVGTHLGYSIYALVNPVTKQLHSFTTGGSKDVFPNYLTVENYIKGRKKQTIN